MKVIFIGVQGSGKGTQAKLVSKELGVVHISTGDLLRSASGALRKDIDSYIVKGNLYPDEKMIKLLEKRFKKEDCKKGWILDGFPRTVPQAKMLGKITEIDEVIEIDITDKEAIRRLTGRVTCEKCGHGYNLNTMPPKVKGKCDIDGSKLVKRADDTLPAIKKRIKTFHKETEPILELYESAKVNGEQSVGKVKKAILKVLKQ